jgi:hypothetical protein
MAMSPTARTATKTLAPINTGASHQYRDSERSQPSAHPMLTLTPLPPPLPFPFLPSRLLAPAELCARSLGPLMCHCISRLRYSAPTRRVSSGRLAGAGHSAQPQRSASYPRELCPKSRLPPSSLRLAPSAGEPLADTVSECEANNQHDCSFQH